MENGNNNDGKAELIPSGAKRKLSDTTKSDENTENDDTTERTEGTSFKEYILKQVNLVFRIYRVCVKKLPYSIFDVRFSSSA